MFGPIAVVLTLAVVQSPNPLEVRQGIDGFIAQLPGPVTGVAKVQDDSIELPGRKLKVRIYWPSGKKNLPVVHMVHGGAFLAGSVEAFDRLSRYICAKSESIVVATGYRLAPEHLYPAAHNDAFEAHRWVTRNAESWGGNARQISVLGDSAGGNLCAAIVQRSSFAKLPLPYRVALVNPALDASRYKRQGFEEYAFYVSVLVPKGAALDNPDLSPLLAKVPAGWPETLVVASEKDPLRAENEEFVAKLKEAGAKVTLYQAKGVSHLGPFWPAAHETARPAMEAVAAFLGRRS